jgi:hypothetical protein
MTRAQSILQWENEVVKHYGSLKDFTDKFTVVHILMLTDDELSRLQYVVDQIEKVPVLKGQEKPFKLQIETLKAFRERMTEAHPNAEHGGKTRTQAI